MPYYGDHLAGDPGLFSFVKKIKLGRIIGGLVKSAVPGAAGVLSAVRAIKGAAPAAPAVVTVPVHRELTVAVPRMAPTVQVSATRARRATKAKAQFTARGKAVSAFAQRMARARAAKRRSFGR